MDRVTRIRPLTALLFCSLFLGHARPGAAENLSTSVAGIVLPRYTSPTTRVVIYRNPKVLVNRLPGDGGTPDFASINTTLSGSFIINSTLIPGLPASAIGVFLFVYAEASRYFGLKADNDLPAPPGGIDANFLQMGYPGSAACPGGVNACDSPPTYVFHENNTFFLPLKDGEIHEVEWEIYSVRSSPGTRLKIICLGYVE